MWKELYSTSYNLKQACTNLSILTVYSWIDELSNEPDLSNLLEFQASPFKMHLKSTFLVWEIEWKLKEEIDWLGTLLSNVIWEEKCEFENTGQ